MLVVHPSNSSLSMVDLFAADFLRKKLEPAEGFEPPT